MKRVARPGSARSAGNLTKPQIEILVSVLPGGTIQTQVPHLGSWAARRAADEFCDTLAMLTGGPTKKMLASELAEDAHQRARDKFLAVAVTATMRRRDDRDVQEERAAILEFDAGFDRRDAELLAGVRRRS